MPFKSLKVSNDELIHLLKWRNIDVSPKLSRKKLLKTLKDYDISDFLKLAEIRGFKVSKETPIEHLEQILITDVNLIKAHKELSNTYFNKINKIRKGIEDFEHKIIANFSLKLSNQIVKSYRDRTDNIKKEIDNFEKNLTVKDNKKLSKQILRSYRDRIDRIQKKINYLENRRYLKSEQNKITNALKLLKQKKLSIKSQEGSISHDDLNIVRNLLNLSKNELHKIAQLRDIDTTNVKKQDLIYMLLRSLLNIKESQYLSLLNKDTTNEVDNKINEIRKLLIEIGKQFNNIEIKKYTQELYDIVKIITSSHENRVNYYSKLSSSLKSIADNIITNRKIKKADLKRISNYLDKILIEIKYKRKSHYIAHDDYYYYGLKDLEDIFGDIDDYYKPFQLDNHFMIKMHLLLTIKNMFVEEQENHHNQ